MAVLTVSNLGHSYGSDVILDGATFALEPGEKVGLVGRNGSGKTTLMKAILGQLHPDSGSIQFSKNARVGYLSQDPDLDPEETLRGAAEAAFAELHALHQKLDAVFESMASADGVELERLMKRQVQLEAEIESAGGYAIDHRIDAMLHGLGFTDEQFTIPVKGLSGGQKGRLGLARLLLEQPDVLLLDEPTNHLDISGRKWLEEFLADEYPGAVIVVSHDRWLLDRVVTRIVEVHLGAIREYPGNYHKFVELRRERQLTDARVYDKQMDKIRREEAYIRKYKAGQRAKQARGRESQLKRFKERELVERPMELDVMKLNLPKPVRSGDMVLTGEGLAKKYGDRQLFTDLSLQLSRGDRVGIIGPNGAGKTTLVKCLLGDETPDEGSVTFGSRLSTGYFRQLHDGLDLSLCVWQQLQKVIGEATQDDGGVPTASEQQARDLAGAFLFSGREQDKLLGELSGGERSRVLLAGLVAGGHNMLVFDEPTNHLDIPSAERLEQALSMKGGFEGTMMLISHDRALLQSTCTRLIIFDGDGNVRLFPGTYLEWEEKQSEQRRAAIEERARVQEEERQREKKRKAEDAERERKAKAAKGPYANLSVSKLEAKIEQIESRLAEIDMEMMTPDVYSDGAMMKALQDERAALQAELKPIEDEWSSR